MSSADQITKQSRSNLAFAFLALPAEKRRDITTFYAFCRRVDDAADDPGIVGQDRNRPDFAPHRLGEPVALGTLPGRR